MSLGYEPSVETVSPFRNKCLSNYNILLVLFLPKRKEKAPEVGYGIGRLRSRQEMLCCFLALAAVL